MGTITDENEGVSDYEPSDIDGEDDYTGHNGRQKSSKQSKKTKDPVNGKSPKILNYDFVLLYGLLFHYFFFDEKNSLTLHIRHIHIQQI